MNSNFCAAGLADMAQAMVDGRAHRCHLDFALHVVDVMTAILRAAEASKTVETETTSERPQALTPKAAEELLA